MLRRHLMHHLPLSLQLLDQLQNSLLGLVGLLQGGHAGGLQDVVLGHVGHRLADVGILKAVGCALQVRHLAGHVAAGRGEAVDGGADDAAL